MPKWRGAAPIIHALANGDSKTGITIIQIKPKHFDNGDIILQKSVQIGPKMRMPELHRMLGELGASCLSVVLNNLPEEVEKALPQPDYGITLGKPALFFF